MPVDKTRISDDDQDLHETAARHRAAASHANFKALSVARPTLEAVELNGLHDVPSSAAAWAIGFTSLSESGHYACPLSFSAANCLRGLEIAWFQTIYSMESSCCVWWRPCVGKRDDDDRVLIATRPMCFVADSKPRGMFCIIGRQRRSHSSSTDLLAHLDGEWLPRSTAHHANRTNFPSVINCRCNGARPAGTRATDSKRKVASSKPTDFHLNVTPPLDVVWTPRRCRLQHRLPDSGGHSGACAALKNNVSILIIGDSVTSQLTLSLASMLGGRIGRNIHRRAYNPTAALTDFAATGCKGRVRINFVRSDLLLWTNRTEPHHRVQSCEKGNLGASFVNRASAHADYVLLHAGHHFVVALDDAAQAQDAAWQERFRHIKIAGKAVIDGARACNCLNRKTSVLLAAEHFNTKSSALKTQCAAVEGAPDLPRNCSAYLHIAQRADVALEALLARGKVDMARREAFFPRSLNHTLASIQAARRLHGFKPESTILLGPTAPVPGCERFHAPIDQSTVAYAFAEPESDDPAINSARSRSPFMPRWRAVHAQIDIASAIASGNKVRFFDLTPMTSTRPDGALSGQGRGAERSTRDGLLAHVPTRSSRCGLGARLQPYTKRSSRISSSSWSTGVAILRIERGVLAGR